ncbi:MAG: hypothetical protein LBF05_00450 [Tannerella sp.]|jgi:hypothetical protein|nr:hypothetical protein [Tannerella sp.]
MREKTNDPQLELLEGEKFKYRCILTNDRESSDTEVKLLYLCSLSAIKCNRACREHYERLLKNGKAKKSALIAVVNKLLKQCFSIVKNKRPYVDHFEADNKFIFNNFYG